MFNVDLSKEIEQLKKTSGMSSMIDRSKSARYRKYEKVDLQKMAEDAQRRQDRILESELEKQMKEAIDSDFKLEICKPDEEYDVYSEKSLENLVLTEDAIKYLDGRKISQKAANEWELGYHRPTRRLSIPVRDPEGHLVTITGRLIYNECTCGYSYKKWKGEDRCPGCGKYWKGSYSPMKYYHGYGFKKRYFLYGEHKVDLSIPVCFLVEGHLDVVAMWQEGYKNALCTMGSEVSHDQLKKLVSWFRVVNVIPDSDMAGQKMQQDIKDALSKHVMVNVFKLPSGEDPCSLLGTGELKMIIGAPERFVIKDKYLEKL